MGKRDARQPIPASADQGKDLREVPAGAPEKVRADAQKQRTLAVTVVPANGFILPNASPPSWLKPKYISVDLEEWQ